ncbi:O-antigen ligase family protein [Azospirillum sp. sgz301742]
MTMQAQFEQPLGVKRSAGPLPAILDDVLSIEASYILFIFAGRYKMLPEFRSFPLDFTFLFFALTLALIVWAVFARRLKAPELDAPNVLMMAFCALSVVSVFWSSVEPRNVDKAWRFILLGASSYFFVVVLAQEAQRRERLVRLMIGFSVALLVYYATYRWVIGIDERELYFTGRIQGNNYLEYGDHAGILFFAGLATVVYGPTKWRLAAIGAAVAALFALMTIGARGPMLFAFLGVPLTVVGLMLCRRVFARGMKRLLVLLAVLFAMAWAGYVALVAIQGAEGASAQLYTVTRMTLQLSNENTHSLDVREEARDLAYRRWLEQPILGWGMGEFRVQHSLEYPHNLSLEILMEMGLAGAVLFFPLLGIAVVTCIRVARRESMGWVDAAIVLMFLTDFLSHTTVQGYLPDDRIYFAYLGLVIGMRSTLARTAPRRAIVR